MSFVGATTTRAIRDYLAMRTLASREDWLFVDVEGRPLKIRHLVQVLHRLSARAGLPLNRRMHPHALRHLAATSWLRNGVGLDQVRRLLGHASLNTTLRYSSLVAASEASRAARSGGWARLARSAGKPHARRSWYAGQERKDGTVAVGRLGMNVLSAGFPRRRVLDGLLQRHRPEL